MRALLIGAATLVSLSVSIEALGLRGEAPPVQMAEVFEAVGSDDHVYIRPPASDVSGFPKNTKPFHRSPCPGLNTLANHGYIPRDGKNLAPQIIKKALMDVFHLSNGLATALVNNLPETLTLADLGVHNSVEHDASLVHDDAYFGHDPSQVNATLVSQFLSRANKDGMLTTKAVAHWRYDREVQCARTDPKYDFGLSRQAIAYAEASALLLAMGDAELERISVTHAESFLLRERIPDDYVRATDEISITKMVYVAAKIRAMASFPWELLSAF